MTETLPLGAPKNRLKAELLAGREQIGLWLTLRSPIAAEIAGHAGFDWCLVDGEHAPNTTVDFQAQFQALATTPASAAARVVANVDWVIKQALDTGVQSIMVPMVGTKAEAEAAAAAVRYAPLGKRGLGPFVARSGQWGRLVDYPKTADAEIFLMVQAESRASVENIDEIANVDGVDCVFIGPSDLAADMGLRGQLYHPEVEAAIAHIIARTRAAGKIAGILTFDAEAWPRYRALGATLLAVAADSFELRRRLTEVAAIAKAK